MAKIEDEDPIFKAGINEGQERMKMKALTFLQEEYMDSKVMRDTPLAAAILEIAGKLSAFLNGKAN